LQDEVVGVGTGDEVGAEVVESGFENRSRLGCLAPRLLAPLFLGEEPGGPDRGKGLHALFRLLLVVAILK